MAEQPSDERGSNKLGALSGRMPPLVVEVMPRDFDHPARPARPAAAGPFGGGIALGHRCRIGRWIGGIAFGGRRCRSFGIRSACLVGLRSRECQPPVALHARKPGGEIGKKLHVERVDDDFLAVGRILDRCALGIPRQDRLNGPQQIDRLKPAIVRLDQIPLPVGGASELLLGGFKPALRIRGERLRVVGGGEG